MKYLITSITISLVFYFSIPSFAEVKLKTIIETERLQNLVLLNYPVKNNSILGIGNGIIYRFNDKKKKFLAVCFHAKYNYNFKDFNKFLNSFPFKVKHHNNDLIIQYGPGLIALDLEKCLNSPGFISSIEIDKNSGLLETGLGGTGVNGFLCDFIIGKKYIYSLHCNGIIRTFDKENYDKIAENNIFTQDLSYTFTNGWNITHQEAQVKLSLDDEDLLVYGIFNDNLNIINLDKDTLSILNVIENECEVFWQNTFGTFVDERLVFLSHDGHSINTYEINNENKCLRRDNREFWKNSIYFEIFNLDKHYLWRQYKLYDLKEETLIYDLCKEVDNIYCEEKDFLDTFPNLSSIKISDDGNAYALTVYKDRFDEKNHGYFIELEGIDIKSNRIIDKLWKRFYEIVD